MADYESESGIPLGLGQLASEAMQMGIRWGAWLSCLA